MLRVVQVHDETQTGSSWAQDGSFAEYRYDPLGRRIMERTRRPASICFSTGHDCLSTLTRFVWAGDQLLWELRVPGGDSVPATSTGLDATSASGDFYGRVSYFHAGGIDKPLLITKEGAESVVPRETWRGQFHAGTSPTTGARRDCPVGVQTNCLQVPWPGMQTNAAHSWGAEQPDIRVWYGGLVDGMRDASGQMYMRNRYYDPATGQFTQTDPIGIAGGLNTYGFGAGDPVTYNDPYGLSADACCPQWLVDGVAGFGDAVSFGLTGVIRRNTPGGDGVDYESDSYAAGTATGIAVGTATGAGMAANAGRGATALSGTARARQLGRAGEAAVGLARNTVRIPSATGRVAYRIPDGLTATTISEIKNVARQGLTSQIRDDIAFAQQTGRQFYLYVNSTTQLSGPLQNAIKAGLVNLRFIP